MSSRLAAVALSVSTLVMAACGSKSESVGSVGSVGSAETSGSPAETAASQAASPPTFVDRVTPAFPDEISGAADIRTVLTQLGFRPDWPLPAGLATSDVVGVKLSQSAGSDDYLTTARVAWRAPATDDPAALSAEWYEIARAVFGVEKSLIPGTFTSSDVEGFDNSAGSDEDPNGHLGVTVIRPVADPTASVIIEIEHRVQTSGSDPDLTLSPTLLAALPDLAGCVPEIVSADYRTYGSPTEFLEEPAYTTIFDANCPTRANYDAAAAWATTSGGSISQTENKVKVFDAPGPNGTKLKIYSSLADDGTSDLRIDTTAVIPAG